MITLPSPFHTPLLRHRHSKAPRLLADKRICDNLSANKKILNIQYLHYVIIIIVVIVIIIPYFTGFQLAHKTVLVSLTKNFLLTVVWLTVHRNSVRIRKTN